MYYEIFKYDTLSAKSLEIYQRFLISAPDLAYSCEKGVIATGLNRGRYSVVFLNAFFEFLTHFTKYVNGASANIRVLPAAQIWCCL